MSSPLSAPTSAYASHEEKKLFFEKDFIHRSGDTIPFVEPNIRPGFEDQDIKAAITKAYGSGQMGNCCISTSCALTGIGLCYIWCNMQLIEEGSIGFVMHSGRPELLLPGRYFITSPLSSFVRKASHAEDYIKVGPITIVRIPQGSIGLAYDNSIPELLLPGRHVRTASTFKYVSTQSLQDEHIEFGPIKLLTVKSGGVRVCYENGKVEIYREGRYAFNSSTFVVAGYINTQQQNVKFTRHKVLLDGGISLYVEGLLTFQVVDPAMLIKQLGERDLLLTLTQVAKAELARLFSMIHLEQISSASQKEKKAGEDLTESKEGETRDAICREILKSVRPIAEGWGVKLINFQLESTELADRKYAAEYEEASLEIAKARSARRAVEATNDILLQNAKAASQCLKIEAEGEKTAALIKAEARAEARRTEASGRQDGAKTMKIPFARKFALGGQQVEFASALKAKVLTVVPGSTIGTALTNQAPFKTKS